MHKIFATLLIAAIPCLASAQYAPTKAGQKFTYSVTDKANNKSSEISVFVDSVYTSAEGTFAITRTVIPNDNPLADNIEIKGISSYTTADAPTTVYVMRGEDFKEFILNMTAEAIRQSGQGTEAQIKEMAEMFKPKGDLKLELDPKAEPGTKIPNSRLRLDVGPQVMTMVISNGVIEGNEDVATEAGTFSCLKISYQMRSTSPEGTSKDYITAWYAPGIGAVKEVKADKRGEVQSEQVISAISE